MQRRSPGRSAAHNPCCRSRGSEAPPAGHPSSTALLKVVRHLSITGFLQRRFAPVLAAIDRDVDLRDFAAARPGEAADFIEARRPRVFVRPMAR